MSTPNDSNLFSTSNESGLFGRPAEAEVPPQPLSGCTDEEFAAALAHVDEILRVQAEAPLTPPAATVSAEPTATAPDPETDDDDMIRPDQVVMVDDVTVEFLPVQPATDGVAMVFPPPAVNSDGLEDAGEDLEVTGQYRVSGHDQLTDPLNDTERMTALPSGCDSDSLPPPLSENRFGLLPPTAMAGTDERLAAMVRDMLNPVEPPRIPSKPLTPNEVLDLLAEHAGDSNSEDLPDLTDLAVEAEPDTVSADAAAPNEVQAALAQVLKTGKERRLPPPPPARRIEVADEDIIESEDVTD